jgi:hypothetical protein
MMQVTYRRTLSAMLMFILSLALVTIACTANDTLFIQLTQTPTPTVTPTPLAITTKFTVGTKVVVISSAPFKIIGLTAKPGQLQGGVDAGNSCTPGNVTAVERVSGSEIDTADKNIYYQITCSGNKKGWIPEYNLTNLFKDKTATVKTAGGTGATLYKSADRTTKPLDKTCPEGATVKMRDVKNSNKAADQSVYVQIICDKLSGFVLDADLVPVQ